MKLKLKNNKIIIFIIILLLILLVRIIYYNFNLMEVMWYDKYSIIAHALGEIDGYSYTNSYESFLKSYNNGVRVFDADVKKTSDGEFVLRHDWNDDLKTYYNSGTIPTLEEFKMNKIYGKYTPITLEEFLKLMDKYSDIYVAFDAKNNIIDVWKNIVNLAKKNNLESVLNRVIVSFYSYEDYYNLKEIYSFKNYAIRYYWDDKSCDELLDFCNKNNIKVINVMKSRLNKEGCNLYQGGINIFIAVENDIKEFNNYKKLGIKGVVSDFIKENMLVK